jgi:undecaprenyl-phosphate 4-deoxy-4-formamido-L-arabinose transferase
MVSIVVPVYNESGCLPELVKRCLGVARELGRPFELLMVDDGSRDGSTSMLRKYAEENPEVVAVILNRNYGQHSAIMCGFAQCSGEVIITLDADLQNPPEEIPRLVKAIDAGNDVVGTVRLNRRDSLFRRGASWLINQVVKKTTGVMMHDYGCMLRAYRKSVVNAMLQCRERSTFIPVLANGFAKQTTEIGVSHSERSIGDSKYSIFKLINLQFDLLTSMTTTPLRLLTYLGALVSVLGVGFGILLLILRVFLGDDWGEQGIFTLFAILFVFVGAQFMAMGLLGEYIGRIYHDVRDRPRYFIDQVVGKSALDDSSPTSSVEVNQKPVVSL